VTFVAQLLSNAHFGPGAATNRRPKPSLRPIPKKRTKKAVALATSEPPTIQTGQFAAGCGAGVIETLFAIGLSPPLAATTLAGLLALVYFTISCQGEAVSGL
jgi:hypothetical protein